VVTLNCKLFSKISVTSNNILKVDLPPHVFIICVAGVESFSSFILNLYLEFSNHVQIVYFAFSIYMKKWTYVCNVELLVFQDLKQFMMWIKVFDSMVWYGNFKYMIFECRNRILKVICWQDKTLHYVKHNATYCKIGSFFVSRSLSFQMMSCCINISTYSLPHCVKSYLPIFCCFWQQLKFCKPGFWRTFEETTRLKLPNVEIVSIKLEKQVVLTWYFGGFPRFWNKNSLHNMKTEWKQNKV